VKGCDEQPGFNGKYRQQRISTTNNDEKKKTTTIKVQPQNNSLHKTMAPA
jgi:hypothetical protein